MTISLTAAHKRLALLWFLGSGAIFAILVGRTIAGAYECLVPATACDPKVAFVWFGSSFLPTLLLIGGVVFGASGRDKDLVMVDSFAYRLSIGVSAFYLVIAVLPVLLTIRDDHPGDALRDSFWIPSMQGLVTLAVGRMFASSQTLPRTT